MEYVWLPRFCEGVSLHDSCLSHTEVLLSSLASLHKDFKDIDKIDNVQIVAAWFVTHHPHRYNIPNSMSALLSALGSIVTAPSFVSSSRRWTLPTCHKMFNQTIFNQQCNYPDTTIFTNSESLYGYVELKPNPGLTSAEAEVSTYSVHFVKVDRMLHPVVKIVLLVCYKCECQSAHKTIHK